jgi:zinc/manganese transport system permease protein
MSATDFTLVWPALIAGLLITATHVPLGIQVLNRGIVFIDLAVAQIAGLGVIAADSLGFEPQGWGVQAAEHLKDLLIGQILWVNPQRLWIDAAIYAAILVIWFGLGQRIGRVGFYTLFACAVTMSVQLVGLYLVFTTLIVPALATRRFKRRRLLACYALGAAGYAAGLGLSLVSDLPPGPLIVCAMTMLGAAVFVLATRRGGAEAIRGSGVESA